VFVAGVIAFVSFAVHRDHSMNPTALYVNTIRNYFLNSNEQSG